MKKLNTIPINLLKQYFELLVEHLPTMFKSFEKSDRYAFFINETGSDLKSKNKRLLFFRKLVTSTLQSLFFKKMDINDVLLLLNCASLEEVRELCEYIIITSEMRELRNYFLAQYQSTAELQLPDLVVLSTNVNRHVWVEMVPVEYLSFSETLFTAISQHPRISISKELIASKNKSLEAMIARDIFVYLFHKKYREVSEEFLVYILSGNNTRRIGEIFDRHLFYMKNKGFRIPEVELFQGIVTTIEKQCSVKPDY